METSWISNTHLYSPNARTQAQGHTKKREHRKQVKTSVQEVL